MKYRFAFVAACYEHGYEIVRAALGRLIRHPPMAALLRCFELQLLGTLGELPVFDRCRPKSAVTAIPVGERRPVRQWWPSASFFTTSSTNLRHRDVAGPEQLVGVVAGTVVVLQSKSAFSHAPKLIFMRNFGGNVLELAIDDH